MGPVLSAEAVTCRINAYLTALDMAPDDGPLASL